MYFKLSQGVGLTDAQVASSFLYRSWATRISSQACVFSSVLVKSVEEFDGEVQSIQLETVVYGPGKELCYETFTLVRGVVDVCAVLNDGQQQYALLVEQLRAAVGRSVLSNPSGCINDGEAIEAAALRELGEETGTKRGIAWSKPRNLNQAAYGTSDPFTVSPGVSNEAVTFFEVHADVSPKVVKLLDGRVRGVAEEGERTVVRLVPLDQVSQALVEGGADLKALTAWRLHEKATTA